MASALEIAQLITQGVQGPQGSEDAAFHTGVVQTWDRLSGTNTILVNGVVLSNLRTLQTGIGLTYVPGEVVMIIRKQSQYFVMGKVTNPGNGAGSGLIRSSENWVTTFNTGGSWGDNPSFPNTPTVQAYIGTSRAAIVMWTAFIYVKAGDSGFGPDVYNPGLAAKIGFAVSGASTIAAGSFSGMEAKTELEFWNPGGGQAVQLRQTCTGFLHFGTGAASNLQSGLNTFTMKYWTSNANAEFGQPTLLVIPL